MRQKPMPAASPLEDPPTEIRRRGPAEKLTLLTIQEAAEICFELGWPVGYKRIAEAVQNGDLPAIKDRNKMAAGGRPRVYIHKHDLDRWLPTLFEPYHPNAKRRGA